jgi:hypothetical protein
VLESPLFATVHEFPASADLYTPADVPAYKFVPSVASERTCDAFGKPVPLHTQTSPLFVDLNTPPANEPAYIVEPSETNVIGKPPSGPDVCTHCAAQRCATDNINAQKNIVAPLMRKLLSEK